MTVAPAAVAGGVEVVLDRAVEGALRRTYPALARQPEPLALADLLAVAAEVRVGEFVLRCGDEQAPTSQSLVWTALDHGGKLPVSGRGESPEEAVAAWLLARLPAPGWQR